jgi:FkbM family methyltransferase
MWDRSSVLFNDLNLTCNWNDYRPFLKRGKVGSAVPFCAHPLSDDQFVSNSVVKKGRHVECDGLPVLLDHSVSSDMEGTSRRAPIYVDIGANIGTCVMQMILTTNATIVAFEPHPYNLFVMTSTFMKLEENVRNRIHLFPVALGAESSESTIHMASDNRGHAVVSKVIRINNKATFLPPMPIRVEPLDSIIKNNVVIHLVKMDAQGFECYIFDGMRRVLLGTRSVFFELEKTVLNGFDKCSPQVLWDKFIQAGFEMHVGGLGGSATQEMPDKGKVNIVALNL